MLDLLVSNQTKGYFESIISILQLLVYPWNASDIFKILNPS